VTYPEANDLALEAVHDHNHLFGVRRGICVILTDTHIHNTVTMTTDDYTHYPREHKKVTTDFC